MLDACLGKNVPVLKYALQYENYQLTSPSAQAYRVPAGPGSPPGPGPRRARVPPRPGPRRARVHHRARVPYILIMADELF